MSMHEFTLVECLLGRVMDVIERDGKIWILSGDSEIVWAIPLICPACGEPWHFVGEAKKITTTLRRNMRGFQLVGINYIESTSVKKITETMDLMYARTSEVFQDLVAEIPIHIGLEKSFSAISLILEKERRGRDPDDIMMVVHPNSLLNAIEIYGWRDKK
jgi:hypothetical protein